MNNNFKPENPTVAVDELAIMIAKGFSSMEKNLGEKINNFEIRMENRFDLVDEKIDKLEAKVDRIDSRLTNQVDYILLHYARREEYKHLDISTCSQSDV